MAISFPFIRPSDADELADAVAKAAADRVRLEIHGGWTKVDIGAPREGVTLLDMVSFRGVIDYDPAELVLTVGAATPLSDIEGLLEDHQQMLAFEPFDYNPIFGDRSSGSTIGGVIAAGVAGSRRLTAGGVRDHLLGFKGVSGRGEAFVAGGKVVKNVTGFDLSKLVCGSWGRLVALTEVTLKVMPRAREATTVFLLGLDAGAAVQAMSLAMGSQAEVSAAAHAPAESGLPMALTGFRLEGFGPSVKARGDMLKRLFSDQGWRVAAESPDDAARYWNGLRTLAPLYGDRPLWRIVVAASRAPLVIDLAERSDARWLMDWAGGLIWLACDADPALVRRAAETAGGHAALVRGPEALRSRVPALHPQPAGVRALEARVRRAFDPAGVFETGRFLDAPDAD